MKMQAPFLMTIAVMLHQILVVRSELELVHVRDIDVDSPGLLNFLVKGKQYNLMSSSFSTSVNTRDKAFVIENVGQINKTVVKPFQATFFHPKDISQVPSNAFDFEAVSIPDGSPLVGKTDGKVLVVDVTDVNFQKFYDLTTPKIPNLKFFQFGRVVWTDLGGIWQKQHFLVCRSATGPELFQLVFYERPRLGDELSKPWEEIILSEGACDSNLAELHVRQSRENWEIVYATGKATQSLNFFWPETPRGGLGWWNDPEQIKGRVLDKGREFYDVRVFDVNKDHVPDVLVTVHGNRTYRNGTLEIWEIDPVNFRNVEGYTRHVIGHGFAPKTTGSDARSPGAVKVFYPTSNHDLKPWILLAGGDDGRAYYFTPKSEDPLNWDYEKFEIPLKSSLSVAGVEAQDVDGDGFSEVFVSLHDTDTVKVFTFRPEISTVAPETTMVRTTPERTTIRPYISTTTSGRPIVTREPSTEVKPQTTRVWTTPPRTTILPTRSTTTTARPIVTREPSTEVKPQTTRVWTTPPRTTIRPYISTTTTARPIVTREPSTEVKPTAQRTTPGSITTRGRTTLPHEEPTPLSRQHPGTKTNKV